MAWSEDAARPLAETFDGSFDSPGVVAAAACVDQAGTGTVAWTLVVAARAAFSYGAVHWFPAQIGLVALTESW